jgi:L-phenylalanine/L-methionine N-acetyltransferase
MTRKISINDFDFIFDLYMHPITNPYLLYEMMERDEFRPIFEDLLNQNIVFIYSENEINIGMFKLIQLQYRTSHINYLGGVAIHPNFAGKGFGSKMLNEIIEIGRERNLKRIELSTATFNQKAIKLYEKHGFVFEGILKNYTYLKAENRYIDEQYMAYLY